MVRKPVWKNDKTQFKQQLGSLRQILKERRKVLSAVGAVVVLGSFVVKEVWGERVHAAQAKIESVVNKSDREQVDVAILAKVTEVQESLDDIQAPTVEKADTNMQRFEQRYRDKTELMDEELEMTLERADSILEILHNHHDLDKQREEVYQLLLAFRRKSTSMSYNGPEDFKNQIVARYQQAKKDEANVDLKAYELVSAAERRADDELQSLNKKQTLSVRLSYFFFGVGWVLGLAANFLGSSGGGAE